MPILLTMTLLAPGIVSCANISVLSLVYEFWRLLVVAVVSFGNS